MKLSGLHILLTYQCTYECEHCFVWGSPRQEGTLTLEQVQEILKQAKEAGVETIYFEGGEPFLFYAILARGVRLAAEMGFSVGIVSNAFWANSVADALENLQPFAGRINDLTVSSDKYHCGERLGERPQNALVAAKWLNIPTGMISIDQPEAGGDASVMYRGRASQLVPRAALHPSTSRAASRSCISPSSPGVCVSRRKWAFRWASSPTRFGRTRWRTPSKISSLSWAAWTI